MANTDFYPIIKYPNDLEKFAKEQNIGLGQNNYRKQFQFPTEVWFFLTCNPGKIFNISILFFGVSLIVFLRSYLIWLLVFFAIFIAINYWLRNQLKEDNIKQIRPDKNHLELLEKHQKNNRSESLVSYCKSHPPLEGIGINASQRGVSEAFFLNYLERFLPNTDIRWQMEFAIPEKNSSYNVDFVLYEPQTGLSIIIEIDEPYASKNKFESYHYVDSNEDDQKDKFLLAHNLIVLRFAEEQIVRYPRSCCLTIANILWQLTEDLVYLHDTDQIKILPPIKRWTSFQARQMWKRNYRQKYLAETGVAYFSPSEYKFARRYQKSGIKKVPRW